MRGLGAHLRSGAGLVEWAVVGVLGFTLGRVMTTVVLEVTTRFAIDLAVWMVVWMAIGVPVRRRQGRRLFERAATAH
jgi:hypothetical protein